MILNGFGFKEDKDQNKLVLEKYDADVFAKGLEILKYELMWRINRKIKFDE